MTQARPGNTANLKAAAARRYQAAAQRAEAGLDMIIRSGEQVTFRGLARTGVSLEFLYSHPPIRSRIEHLRTRQQAAAPASHPPAGTGEPDQASSVIRTLSAELTALKARHRAEIARLRQELEAAHGENLLLRRRLGHLPAAADATPTGPPLAPPGT